MTSPVPYQRGDRIALVATDDPDTRLRPGDQGTVTRWDPAQGQLHIRWDSGSTLTMLPGDGDQVRLLARASGQDGTEPEDPLVTRAGELGRDAGRAAATWVFDGSTPEVLCTLSSRATVEPYLGRLWRHSGCRHRRWHWERDTEHKYPLF